MSKMKFCKIYLTIWEFIPILYGMQKITLFIHRLHSDNESTTGGFAAFTHNAVMKNQIKSIK